MQQQNDIQGYDDFSIQGLFDSCSGTRSVLESEVVYTTVQAAFAGATILVGVVSVSNIWEISRNTTVKCQPH